jgi:hypothetical protein
LTGNQDQLRHTGFYFQKITYFKDNRRRKSLKVAFFEVSISVDYFKMHSQVKKVEVQS